MTFEVSIRKVVIQQGGVDQFVTGKILTGLGQNSGKAWKIKRVEFFLDPVQMRQWTGGSDISLELAVSAGPVPTSIIRPSISTYICGRSWAVFVGATSGPVDIEGTWIWDAPTGYLVVGDFLNVQLFSANCGVINKAHFTVYYTVVNVTEMQEIQLRAR